MGKDVSRRILVQIKERMGKKAWKGHEKINLSQKRIQKGLKGGQVVCYYRKGINKLQKDLKNERRHLRLIGIWQ
jgi:hypothetical protein